ncbi:Adenylate cyclase [hydrothermal vent metagenome]|uniref:Adenylate cyclase n=1 Tax=hydrothermal vent metagenome TaxID=652676 RepID=A0A3B1BWU9_9ZZZZ
MSRFKSPVLIALLNGLLGVLLFLTPWASQLEEDYGLGWLFQTRGPRPAPEQVVLVTMDTESMKELGLERLHRKWPRALHARLVDRLSLAGAAVISFDVFFREPRDSTSDQALADAIRRAGNVLLFRMVQKDAVQVDDGSGQSAMVFTELVLDPAPLFVNSAAALAPFTLPSVPVKVSQFWKFKPELGDMATLPTMAFQYFALSSYETFHRLLPVDGPAFPATAEAMLQEPGLAQYMRQVRSMFAQQEGLGGQLRHTLHAEMAAGNISQSQLLDALISLYSGAHNNFLNYYGPPHAIRGISYFRVLEMTADELQRQFQGKAVFVGVSEAFQWDQQDTFYTVYSDSQTGHNISGVEIAATAFNNLLQREWLEPLHLGFELLLVLLWGGVIGFLCCALSVGRTVIAVLLLVAVYVLIVLKCFAEIYLWLPLVVPVVIQVLPVLFITTVMGYMEAHGERAKIAYALGRYLPQQVVEDLAKSVRKIGGPGKTVYGVCLATDAEQYSQLAESLPPNELREFLNAYYEIIFAAIRSHGGVISDVIGDAVLALWMEPKPRDELRSQACLAALDVLKAVTEFNQLQPRHRLPTRIGLHYGEVCIGDVGAGDHFEYRAIGDVVNTATRIEGVNKYFGSRLLVSKEGLEGVGGLVSRELGYFRLAGKERAVQLFELLGVQQECSKSTYVLVGKFADGLATFRGREWEVASAVFSDLVKTHGEDGPAQFYLELCDKYRATPPEPQWDGVIELDKK